MTLLYWHSLLIQLVCPFLVYNVCAALQDLVRCKFPATVTFDFTQNGGIFCLRVLSKCKFKLRVIGVIDFFVYRTISFVLLSK